MTLRPPRLEETAAVATVLSRFFPDPVSAAEMHTAWTLPRFDRDRDARVAVSEDGDVTGYADVEAVGDDGRRARVYVVGEPAEQLADWVESRARELVRRPARVFSSAWSENERGKRLLEARGFRLVRHFFTMAIDLGGPIETPDWPDRVSVRSLQPGDERTFYDVHQETFEDHWEHVRRPYDEWAHWQLAADRFRPELWFLAEEDGESAGVSICTPDAARDDIGWVAILGVRRPWRRRGVGRALLLHSFAELRRHGFARVLLGVDADSPTGAVRLYERAGMSVVHRFDSYEKHLA